MPKTKSGKPIPYMSGGFNIKDLLSDESEEFSDKVSDQEKREFIMDVQKVGRNTVADMTGSDLDTAYQKALKDAEGKNMGGVVVDDLGYAQGGLSFDKRGPIRYAKGGAVKGKKFSGSY